MGWSRRRSRRRNAPLLLGVIGLVALWATACGTGTDSAIDGAAALGIAMTETASAAATLAGHRALVLQRGDGVAVGELAAALLAQQGRLQAMSAQLSAMLFAMPLHYSHGQGAVLEIGAVEGDIASLRAITRALDETAAALRADGARLRALGEEETAQRHLEAHARWLEQSGGRLERRAEALEDQIRAQQRVTGQGGRQ